MPVISRSVPDRGKDLRTIDFARVGKIALERDLPAAPNDPAAFAGRGRNCRAHPANNAALTQTRCKENQYFQDFSWFTATQHMVNESKCQHCLSR